MCDHLQLFYLFKEFHPLGCDVMCFGRNVPFFFFFWRQMLHQSFTPTMQIAGPPLPQPPVMTNLYQTTHHHVPKYVIRFCHFHVLLFLCTCV
jgi:hypothetical protein